MSSDSPARRVVLLDHDQGAYVQLCRRLSAVRGHGYELVRRGSWEELQSDLAAGGVRAVLLGTDFFDSARECEVPLIHLSVSPEQAPLPSFIQDSIWNQAA